MSVVAELQQFIVSELTQGRGIDTVAADEDLLASGVIDSHGVVELVGFIERHYGVTIDDDDLTPENFESLTTIEAFIAAKRGVGA
jgi:acyl carrier protein